MHAYINNVRAKAIYTFLVFEFIAKLINAKEIPNRTNKPSAVGKKKFSQLKSLKGFGLNRTLNIVGMIINNERDIMIPSVSFDLINKKLIIIIKIDNVKKEIFKLIPFCLS